MNLACPRCRGPVRIAYDKTDEMAWVFCVSGQACGAQWDWAGIEVAERRPDSEDHASPTRAEVSEYSRRIRTTPGPTRSVNGQIVLCGDCGHPALDHSNGSPHLGPCWHRIGPTVLDVSGSRSWEVCPCRAVADPTVLDVEAP